MTTPIDFGNCSQAVPHERRFNPRAKPKKSPGPGSYDIVNTRTDVTTKYKTTPTYKMGSSTAPRFNKKAHDTISPGPGIYQLNPSVGDQTLSTKRSAGRVTFNMGKRGEKKRYQGSLVHAYIDPHSRLDTRSASAFGASTADRFAQSKRDILNSCSPGPGSAWKHGIYSGLSKRGGATLGTARRFMNDKTLCPFGRPLLRVLHKPRYLGEHGCPAAAALPAHGVKCIGCNYSQSAFQSGYSRIRQRPPTQP